MLRVSWYLNDHVRFYVRKIVSLLAYWLIWWQMINILVILVVKKSTHFKQILPFEKRQHPQMDFSMTICLICMAIYFVLLLLICLTPQMETHRMDWLQSVQHRYQFDSADIDFIFLASNNRSHTMTFRMFSSIITLGVALKTSHYGSQWNGSKRVSRWTVNVYILRMNEVECLSPRRGRTEHYGSGSR